MNKRYRKNRQNQEYYFPLLLVVILLSFGADIISSLYLSSDWIFPFAAAGNYFEIILNTMLIPIYYQYVCVQILNIELPLKRKINTILWIMAALCSILVISTAFNEQIFYFDEARIYHRGPLFWIPMCILFAMMVILEGFIISQKTKIERNHYKSLILFLVLPLIGWALQFFIYGLPFALISVTFAAQIIFTNIQNRSMDTDYLTGVFNRQSLDHHMQDKIDHTSGNHSFSAILLDIDNFKVINDSLGHYEGDIALIHTANLLRSSIGHKDFIARYGGDEFCILFDEDDSSALEEIVNQIRKNLIAFNRNTKKPYELNFSIGYAVYQPSMGNSTEHFLEVIDQKMYKEKKSHKGEFNYKI